MMTTAYLAELAGETVAGAAVQGQTMLWNANCAQKEQKVCTQEKHQEIRTPDVWSMRQIVVLAWKSRSPNKRTPGGGWAVGSGEHVKNHF